MKAMLMLLGSLMSTSVLAGDYFAKSSAGRTLTLSINDQVLTQSTQTASLCADSAAQFSQFKLWMPEHGHGSTPTVLAPMTERCARVEKINFVMVGNWELRVKMSDGDQAVFAVEVK